MSSPPPLSRPSIATAVTIPPDPDPDPPPKNSASSTSFLWSSLFADSGTSISPSSSPSYLPDGTPVVLTPASVILKASSSWAGHLLCRFLGEPPSPAKFYSDLNRIWGKHGDISVRRFSSGTFLVHVPSVGTRKWILETGLWSSGTVSFIVSEWSVNPSLAAPPKLTSASTLLTIGQIPLQLWSHEAVACIAGGVAKLIPGTRASLPRTSLGTATIRAIVPLGSPLPSSVLVKDSNGDSVMVSIDYGKLLHLCPLCNSYGHQSHRCPKKSVSVASPAHHSSALVDSNITKIQNRKPNESIVSDITRIQSGTKSETKCPNAHSDAEMDVDSTHNDIELHQMQLPPNQIQSPPEDSAADQVLQSDNMVCEDSDSKCTTDPLPVSVASSSATVQKSQVQSSFPEEASKSLFEPSAVRTISPSPAETLNDTKPVSSPSEELIPYSFTTQDPPLHIFSFPPPSTQALQYPHMSTSLTEPLTQTHLIVDQAAKQENLQCKELGSQCSSECVSDTSHIPDSSTSLITDSCLTKHPSVEMMSNLKKGDSRSKRKDKSAMKSSLSCKLESHKFKPMGIVEKRRKKIQNELIPEDEDLVPCIQEMNSDKKNTTHYEALNAHRFLSKLASSETESSET